MKQKNNYIYLQKNEIQMCIVTSRFNNKFHILARKILNLFLGCQHCAILCKRKVQSVATWKYAINKCQKTKHCDSLTDVLHSESTQHSEEHECLKVVVIGGGELAPTAEPHEARPRVLPGGVGAATAPLLRHAQGLRDEPSWSQQVQRQGSQEFAL